MVARSVWNGGRWRVVQAETAEGNAMLRLIGIVVLVVIVLGVLMVFGLLDAIF
jgi:hypothetical protein